MIKFLQVSAVNHLNGAFSELQSYSQYHPSRGYWWQTNKQTDPLEQQKKEKEKKVFNALYY